MKIYVAGPMRGHPFFNRQAFVDATVALRAKGHEVFSPVESTEAIYGPHIYLDNPEGDEPKAGIHGRTVFGADLAYICAHADAVALLPGWENSKGAKAEKAVAHALGLQVILVMDMTDNEAAEVEAELTKRGMRHRFLG